MLIAENYRGIGRMLLLMIVVSGVSTTARAGFIDRLSATDPTLSDLAGGPPESVPVGTRLAIAPLGERAFDPQIRCFDHLVQKPLHLLGASPQRATGDEDWSSLMDGVARQSDVPQPMNAPDNWWILSNIPGQFGDRIDFHNERRRSREQGFVDSNVREGPPLDRVDAPSTLISFGIGFVILSLLSPRSRPIWRFLRFRGRRTRRHSFSRYYC